MSDIFLNNEVMMIHFTIPLAPISKKNNQQKCLSYMPTKRLCDLTNMLEAVDDVMVKAGLLKDDNYKIIVSHDGSRVLYDKANPRTEVYIERTDE